jgi:hypothetical protein
MERKSEKYVTYRTFRSKDNLVNGKFIYDMRGAITACCEVDPEAKQIKVGFSFLNPTDSQFLVRGKGLAKKKLLSDPILLENVGVNEKGKLKVTDTVLQYLVRLTESSMKEFTEKLKIKEYHGDLMKCSFMQWFPLLLDHLGGYT